MPQETTDELVDVLRKLREHTNFLDELGVESIGENIGENIGLDSPGEVSVPLSTAPPPPLTLATEKRTREVPRPTAVAAASGNSLFGDVANSEPAPAKSTETLELIWSDIGDCTRCGLCEGRTQVVNTHGNRQARLMFVGEAPGADEDAQGKPFVGRAGQLLTKMIEAMGMKRDDVIIGNVNRCRPPGNRQPTLEEAAICRPFLFREIVAIQPEVIVVMGNTALRNLLEVREGITRVRGKFQDFRGIKVMPTFHPAYLLRDPSKKRETWEDLKMVMDYLENNPPKLKS